ncbi:MAG: hypothetical protein GF311_04970 [Candidatus Lokiarchaeota archaeon]|nr:hypothetical protein [Candidatus Lokiarchaeota archaeon]
MVFEIIYHTLGFLIMALMIGLSIKFYINYKYTGQKELIGGVLMGLSFLGGLVYFSFQFLLGLFGIEVSVDDKTLIFINFGLIPLLVMSWLYVFYQLLYPDSKKVLAFLIIMLIISIIWEISFIYMVFFSTLTAEVIGDIAFIFDAFSMLVSLIPLAILAIKSIRSKDKVLKYRGIMLIIGFLLAGVSLVVDEGIFDPNNAIIEIIARIALIFGLFLALYGFFLTEESKLYKFISGISSE